VTSVRAVVPRVLLLLLTLAALVTVTAACGSGVRHPVMSKTTTAPAAAAGAAGAAARATRIENLKPGAHWQITRPAPVSELAGWADHVSVLPGESVRLFVRSARPWAATAFRSGWYGGTGGHQVWRSPGELAARQPAPRVSGPGTVSAADWHPSLTVSTAGWVPGDYLFRLDGSDGRSSYIPLTVRTPGAQGRLVVLNAVTTWQAYNHFGGYSLYAGPSGSFGSRARIVSFDRPYDFGNGAADFTGNERPVVELAERLGLPLAYATSSDLAADPHLLDGALAVLSLGHDEYWSLGMRASLTAARDAGAGIAFLGANAIYRRIRLLPSPLGPDRVEVNYKIAAEDPAVHRDPASATGNWPGPPEAEPESSLTGEPYRCNPVSAAMRFTGADAWLLAGSGLRAGSSLPGQVGSEYDGFGQPHPRPIDVVADSPLTCRGRRDTAAVTWYTTARGAGVFDAGTSAWVCAVDNACAPGAGGPLARKAITAITTNLLRAFAAGHPGAAHPATGAADPRTTGAAPPPAGD
jgi:hypothetical protein